MRLLIWEFPKIRGTWFWVSLQYGSYYLLYHCLLFLKTRISPFRRAVLLSTSNTSALLEEGINGLRWFWITSAHPYHIYTNLICTCVYTYVCMYIPLLYTCYIFIFIYYILLYIPDEVDVVMQTPGANQGGPLDARRRKAIWAEGLGFRACTIGILLGEL